MAVADDEHNGVGVLHIYLPQKVGIDAHVALKIIAGLSVSHIVAGAPCVGPDTIAVGETYREAFFKIIRERG